MLKLRRVYDGANIFGTFLYAPPEEDVDEVVLHDRYQNTTPLYYTIRNKGRYPLAYIEVPLEIATLVSSNYGDRVFKEDKISRYIEYRGEEYPDKDTFYAPPKHFTDSIIVGWAYDYDGDFDTKYPDIISQVYTLEDIVADIKNACENFLKQYHIAKRKASINKPVFEARMAAEMSTSVKNTIRDFLNAEPELTYYGCDINIKPDENDTDYMKIIVKPSLVFRVKGENS